MSNAVEENFLVDRALRLLFTLVALLIVVSILRTVMYRDEFVWSWALGLTMLVLPALYLAATLFALTRGSGARVNLLLATISLIAALYLGNLALMLAGPFITLPAEFDRRSKLQVVLDMRAQGIDAQPSIHPKDFMVRPLRLDNGEDAVPLASISKSTTVFCNETGKYYIFDSDEYGFTNPPTLHDRERLDLALVGDSFTQGFCAPDGTSYAERIRAAFPLSLNLGNNGNGPLVELATIRELAPIKSRYVLWFYFEGNDPEDLSRELQNPVLANYLHDRTFTQSLKNNQERTDRNLRTFIEKGIADELASLSFAGTMKRLPENFKLWLKLWHVRALLNVNDVRRNWPLHRWNYQSSEAEVQQAMRKIFEESRDLVEGWGGKMIVFYLPSFRTYGYGVNHPWRERSLEIFKDLNIEVVDLVPVFRNHPDPFELFAYRKEGHYTAKGNEVVSKVVLDYLQQKGVHPSR